MFPLFFLRSIALVLVYHLPEATYAGQDDLHVNENQVPGRVSLVTIFNPARVIRLLKVRWKIKKKKGIKFSFRKFRSFRAFSFVGIKKYPHSLEDDFF